MATLRRRYRELTIYGRGLRSALGQKEKLSLRANVFQDSTDNINAPAAAKASNFWLQIT
jgi:hypothetical protein